MNIEKWIAANTHSLSGKTVAITGSTGGLGKEICRHLASLGASFILLDRNAERSNAFRGELLSSFSGIDVTCVQCELEDGASVDKACQRVLELGADVLILNAGAYSIPRHVCDNGYDNIFTINFISPYRMVNALLPMLKERSGRVVAVGSIAHRYSRTDERDVDFSGRARASLAYGNAKRYLMFSMYALFRNQENVTLSVTHPGITFTNITAHYPKVIFAVIKHPMKLIFMKPRKAALPILYGLFADVPSDSWIGPRLFNVWGLPRVKKLRTAGSEEKGQIIKTAENIYEKIK